GMTSKEELTWAILDNALKLVDADMGSIMLIERETRDLVIMVAKGIPRDIVEQTRMKVGEGIAGKVAKTGKAIFVENIEQDSRYQRANLERYGSKSFISVPMRVKNRVIGVLSVNSSNPDRVFENRDLRLLTILADQAAITLENSDLYENLQQFYLEMVQTLARTIDAKDAYTHEHADRARYYARAVAKELSLPEQIVRHVEYAALMHDIGKIGIEKTILHKPGKLTTEEMEIIKKHPAIGNKIIAPVAFLAPVAPMVLYHQEWFNGQGYPDGLAGEEIPLGARIVAIIDAFDAMTSDRPYRKALPQEKALAELKAYAGTQFDPRVVDAFIKVIEREKSAQSQDKPS
ncbi:MAG: GAF domain-containing protein, partial [Elusimicrobia bacterium]|nr:GAF domain-containing protein [Elusimicrobiota bacterium]MBD3411635.1 GAF domain-containing protein [Elusimicrobiota bacterium]